MVVVRLLLLTCVLGLTGCATMGPSASQQSPGKALWGQVSSASVSEQVPEIEARMSELFQQPLTAERCTTHRAALEHYLDRLPIDLSNWQTARDCAELIQDRKNSDTQKHIALR